MNFYVIWGEHDRSPDNDDDQNDQRQPDYLQDSLHSRREFV
jgi:hypothetical protein